MTEEIARWFLAGIGVGMIIIGIINYIIDREIWKNKRR